MFQIRGRLPITVKLTGKQTGFGFKFILPKNYPIERPYVYLDEKEDPEIVEMVDYVDKGNIMNFDYLGKWTANSNNIAQLPNN